MRPLMSARLAGPFDDRRVVLVDLDLLGPAEVGERDAFELDAQVFEDRLAAGQDGDVFEHGLAAIAVAGALTAQHLNVPRSLLMTSVARASPSTSSAMIRSGLPALTTFFEDRHQILDVADLLLVDEDVGVFELALPSSAGR